MKKHGVSILADATVNFYPLYSRRVGLSAEYVCNIEKCRKPAPAADVLAKIALVMNFSKEETERMYDLAASSKNMENSVPEDLKGFLNDNHVVVTALRTAKDVDATDEEWILKV